MARSRLCVITYDIRSSRQRAKAAQILQRQAARVQLSVYEARLTKKDCKELYQEVKQLLEPGDRLRVYSIPDNALNSCYSEGGPDINQGARYWLC